MIPRKRIIELCETIAWNKVLSENRPPYSQVLLAESAFILRDYDLLSVREFTEKYQEHIHQRSRQPNGPDSRAALYRESFAVPHNRKE